MTKVAPCARGMSTDVVTIELGVDAFDVVQVTEIVLEFGFGDQD